MSTPAGSTVSEIESAVSDGGANSSGERPQWFRLRRFMRRRSSLFRTLLSIALGLGIWQLVALHSSRLVTATLQQIWSALMDQIRAHTLFVNLEATFVAFAIGFLIAAIGGVIIGLIMATNKWVFDLADPWVSALRSTPLITVAPLFILALGISLKAKVAIVILVAIFPVILNTADGIRAADRGLLDVAYSFGASRIQVFRRVLIPSAIPAIVGGWRIAINMALIGVVVAEFFGSRHGIGYMVFEASQLFDTGTVFLGVGILVIAGTIATKLMYALERRLAPWRSYDVAEKRRPQRRPTARPGASGGGQKL